MEADSSNIIEITSIDNEGRGIGHLNDKTIFVDNALINEIVHFKVLKKKKNILFARSEKILKESVQRVKPICSVYGVCGGCSMQHFEVSAQLAYKLRAFEETLQHLGKVKAETILPPISPIIRIPKISRVVSVLPNGTLLNPPRKPNPIPAPGTA